MNSFHALWRTVATGAAIAALSLLSACGPAQPAYKFSATPTEVAINGAAIIDVRLIHAPTGKPVVDAVIFDARFDMSPDSMGAMTAPAALQGSPEPGVYRFEVAPNMAGRWALTLSAKVQGEAETITGSVVVAAH